MEARLAGEAGLQYSFNKHFVHPIMTSEVKMAHQNYPMLRWGLGIYSL